MGSTIESNLISAEHELTASGPLAGSTVLIAPQTPVRRSPGADRAISTVPDCFHCGEPCRAETLESDGKAFCCQGCKFVHDLLAESGLERFYDLSLHPGVRVNGKSARHRWTYLDDPAIAAKLLDFSDDRVSRVTLQIPSIHCVACVWLLENLFRLHEGIGRSQVNFARRELSVTFANDKLALSALAALLTSLGYEPALTLDTLAERRPGFSPGRQWLQVGVAGFAFGNIMLFSLPGYMGLDSLSGPLFRAVFGWLSLLLAIPVLAYSAADYWKSALLSWKRRTMTLDVPIAAGLVAIYAQSAFEILGNHGEGYLDSFSGLVFFLLLGRMFQQKTFERMAFDRDYKCFFPLSVVRQTPHGEETVSISHLNVGDRVVLRSGELLPADAVLRDGEALIDYSFVTGESEPVRRSVGDHLYAGGKQVGGAIQVEIVKPVSQSYLTSLWNDAAFQKNNTADLDTLTNRYSRRFTLLVTIIAAGAALYWLLTGDPARGVKAFTSVLIVACPCALALAAPFTLGSAQRLLARIGVFLKNTHVVEKLAHVDTVVLDKTGTLTASTPDARFTSFHENPLNAAEAKAIRAVARQSTHPYSRRIADRLSAGAGPLVVVRNFQEKAGLGVSGEAGGIHVALGSRTWLESLGIPTQEANANVQVGIDGRHRGGFALRNGLRPDLDQMLAKLAAGRQLFLLSGDNERERELFQQFPALQGNLRFNQSPVDKLAFVRNLQAERKTVMMVGDGLNDAGALKQSDAGMAVVEHSGAFSPASDIICTADQVHELPGILEFAKLSTRIVRLSFGISALYNVLGITIAAAGILSPLICAVLMPASSISVVLFACGATSRAARRLELTSSATGPGFPFPSQAT